MGSARWRAAGGGASFPAGAANRALGVGGTLTAGVSLELSPRLGIPLDYMYAGNPVDSTVLPGTELTGLHASHVFGLGARYTFIDGGVLRVHALLQPGVTYRRVSIKKVVGTSVTAFCDPFVLFCVPQATPITEALGSRSETDFSLAAGLGMAIAGGPIKPYLEVRVLWLAGKNVTDAAGKSRSTATTLVPILLGVRY